MTIEFLLLLLISIMFLLSDYILWKDIFSPLFITSVPILFLLIFNQIWAVNHGFYDLSSAREFFLILLIAWFIALISSLLTKLISLTLVKKSFTKKHLEKNNNNKNKKNNRKDIKLIITITAICLNLYVLYLIFINNVDLHIIGKYFLSHGIAGHLVLYLPLGYCYIYGTVNKTSFKEKIILLLCLIPAIIYGTRGSVLMALISGLFLRGYYVKVWPSKMTILLTPLFGILLMMLSYIYKNFTGHVSATTDEIFYHVIGYFIAGIQGANQLLTSNVDRSPYLDITFNGLMNIFLFIQGKSSFLNNSTPDLFLINNYTQQGVNVTTSFGTVFFGLGKFNAILYYTIYFLIFYIGYLYSKTSRNVSFLLFYAFMMSGLFLGFFQHYLGLLFYIESFILILVINFIGYFRDEYKKNHSTIIGK